jgi:hypothetical protein
MNRPYEYIRQNDHCRHFNFFLKSSRTSRGKAGWIAESRLREADCGFFIPNSEIRNPQPSILGVDHIDGQGIFFAHRPESMGKAGIEVKAIASLQQECLIFVVALELPF